MRFTRSLVVAAMAALAIPVSQMGASADLDSFPGSVDSVVHGDLEAYEWMLPAVNADAAHTAATGDGVMVAVIDTGVDDTHPDLEGQVVPGAYVRQVGDSRRVELVPATTTADTGDDWYFHGTHVSGIVAGDDDGNGITGVAPGAKVMPIHTFPRDVYMRDVAFWGIVADSIDFSVANGVDVINMSLGGQSSGIVPTDDSQKYLDSLHAVCDSVAAARAAGVVVVASAGNSGDWGNPEMVPGSCPGTFTVAAMSPSFDRTYWSSYDAAVDVIAPGQDVLSADSTVADTSPTPHVFASGTSMASPVVAGVAALVLDEHPTWTPQQVEDQITSTAKDLGVSGRDPQYGWGLVDAAAAVGVPAPSPEEQNFFGAWYEPAWGGKNGEAVISWSVPAADPVDGYTVRVYTDATTASYDVDGNTVRSNVLLPPGAWFTVTAHTDAGDVTTYPGNRWTREHGVKLPKLEHSANVRTSEGMRVTWDRPRKSEQDQIDKIRIIVRLDVGRGAAQTILIDHGKRFPTSATAGLSPQSRWSDAKTSVVVYDLDDEGIVVSHRSWVVHPMSPAVFGSHVQRLHQAGAGMVEVTGAMSPMNRQRVCGRDRCAGEQATLIVDRGRTKQRLPVVFTDEGVFHELVSFARGTKALRLRIDGPKSVSSGPFRRFSIDGSDNDRCVTAPRARGC
jgi:hypothetical protein